MMSIQSSTANNQTVGLSGIDVSTARCLMQLRAMPTGWPSIHTTADLEGASSAPAASRQSLLKHMSQATTDMQPLPKVAS